MFYFLAFPWLATASISFFISLAAARILSRGLMEINLLPRERITFGESVRAAAFAGESRRLDFLFLLYQDKRKRRKFYT